MRKALFVLVTAAVATVGLPCGGSANAYGPGKELSRFADTRITESSGIVSSSSQERILFTHNDSGDTARSPTQVPLPFTQQGEAIAYSRNGRSLVTSTEGVNAPVHLLR